MSSFRSGWIQFLKRCKSEIGGASLQGWFFGLASFSSSWDHSRGRDMAWTSSRLQSSQRHAPGGKSTPRDRSSRENPRKSSHQVSVGHLCVLGVGASGQVAATGDGMFPKGKGKEGLFSEGGTDANWVKTTDATSYSPRLCSLGKKWKCNSSHVMRFCKMQLVNVWVADALGALPPSPHPYHIYTWSPTLMSALAPICLRDFCWLPDPASSLCHSRLC